MPSPFSSAAKWIGTGIARPEARRFVEGRGRYLDDIVLPGMLHTVFLRSPFARARFRIGDLSPARSMPGVAAIVTGADLSAICKPWQTRFTSIPAHGSSPQPPLATEEAYWQGEPVIAVVATTRAEAEDALEAIDIEWEEQAPTVDPRAALAEGAKPCHPALANNLALDRAKTHGDIDQALKSAACVVQRRMTFGRQTGVPLEPRGTIAHFDARTGNLELYISHQAPFQVQEVMAAQLGLPLEQVHVHCPDIGGGFGIKLHAYPDEMAVAAIAILLGKPIKFQADRLESFVSDVHARDAEVEASLAVDSQGRILGLKAEFLFAFGAYSCYPRSSLGEAIQALELCGAPYDIPAFHGRVRAAYLNKVPTGAYRAVGQPIACAVMEQLLDDAAACLHIDPLEIRRVNHRDPARSDDVLGPLSIDECLTRIAENMNYPALRAEQARLRGEGKWRGIGICSFVEITGVGSALYGPNGVPVAGKEGVRLDLSTSGRIVCRTSAVDMGQGTRTGIAQIIADVLDVDPDQVVVASGDTDIDPMGGGAWASRGIALAGEAALEAATELATRIIAIAEGAAGAAKGTLQLRDGAVRDADGRHVMSLADVGTLGHYCCHTATLGVAPSLTVERSFAPATKPYFAANGVQAAYVEVDPATGVIHVLDFWVVEDCGRIINPLLADEQVRGGVVQGIGAALFEHCRYSETGQLTNASLADYLLPMAPEMPDIHIDHVSTPERETKLGAKGVGEAGTVGAIGALWCAVSDAIRHAGATVERQPFTPADLIEALHPESGTQRPVQADAEKPASDSRSLA